MRVEAFLFKKLGNLGLLLLGAEPLIASDVEVSSPLAKEPGGGDMALSISVPSRIHVSERTIVM